MIQPAFFFYQTISTADEILPPESGFKHRSPRQARPGGIR